MNVLVLGSGGREHAIAWKLAESPRLNDLFIAPGNAGTLLEGKNVNISLDDFAAIASFCLENAVELLVVGPEDPLVNGITEFVKEAVPGIRVLGPGKDGARLEGSKDFAKEFMKRHNIPTAVHQSFQRQELPQALAFIDMLEPPFVIKADGLAAGKGVIIAADRLEAREALSEMLGKGRFGKASDCVLIEEFLDGIEMSVFVISDGSDYVILPSAKDYKRIGEGDTGPNTGGMGTISPVPFADAAFMEKVEAGIIRPTVSGLKADGIDYRGFIFFGLMVCAGEPFVIEYNVRLGDPEAESILPRIQGDFLTLLESAASGFVDKSAVKESPEWSATVMMVSGGYPGSYTKGKVISGLNLENLGGKVFHAGTTLDAQGRVVSNGGRVLGVNSLGSSMDEALASAYERVGSIDFEGANYRRDLGLDLRSYTGKSS